MDARHPSAPEEDEGDSDGEAGHVTAARPDGSPRYVLPASGPLAKRSQNRPVDVYFHTNDT